MRGQLSHHINVRCLVCMFGVWYTHLCLMDMCALSGVYAGIHLWDQAWTKEWIAYRLFVGAENSVSWDVTLCPGRWRYHWEPFTEHCSITPQTTEISTARTSYFCIHMGHSKHLCSLKTYDCHNLWISKKIESQIRCCFPAGWYVSYECSVIFLWVGLWWYSICLLNLDIKLAQRYPDFAWFFYTVTF